jgi:hypothetical protein
MMHTMFLRPSTTTPTHGSTSQPPTTVPEAQPAPNNIPSAEPHVSFAHLTTYDSDLDDSSEDDGTDSESEDNYAKVSKRLPVAPPLKRQKLTVPYREQRKQRHKQRREECRKALMDIEKLLQSKKTLFVAGARGLQSRRTYAIASHLKMVVQNGRKWTDASERSAESHGFAAKWGGRQLRGWSRKWIETRELPKSLKGRHAKVYSLLSDPAVAAELRAYVRSNKWAMNPTKLAEFSQKQLVGTAADKYLRHIIGEEMPRGLKRYMEIELFPRIHLKVGRGISLSTARRWLHLEGFRYISHKKGLYFDGHDRPDVLAYRQNYFLPTMKSFESRLVRYIVGDVDKTVLPSNYVERALVLCAHDESTSQANDAPEKAWVLEEQHHLRKKGPGRGLHQSDVICSTVGWLSDASQTLEYGKNYEGYWTGELFVRQVCLPFKFSITVIIF